MYAVFHSIKIATCSSLVANSLAIIAAKSITKEFKETPFYANRKAEQRRNQLAKQALKNSRK